MKIEEKNLIIEALENINPFNIDDGLVKISKEFHLQVEDIETIYDEGKNNFTASCKRYKIKENKLNVTICEVLNFFIEENKPLARNRLSRYLKEDLSYDDKSDYAFNYLLKDSLGYLKCTHLIKDVSKNEQKRVQNKKLTFYQVSSEYWFTNSQYVIHNKELLKILTPLLVEYVKSSLHANVMNFFERIDSIFRYVIQPYKNHNENFTLEKYLVDNIYNEIQIRVVDHTEQSTNTITVNNMTLHTDIIRITPLSILFSDEEKILSYNNEGNETEEIPLNDIIRVIVDKDKLPTNKKVTKKHSNAFAYIKDGRHFYLTNPNYIKDNIGTEYFIEDKEEIILELPLTILEYFRIKPLADMTLYVTPSEIKQFNTKHKNISTQALHFYVVANDTIENATSIIMHILNDVQIIEPKELTESVQKNINQFISKHPQKKM